MPASSGCRRCCCCFRCCCCCRCCRCCCPGRPGLPLVRRVCRHLQVVNNTIFLINVGLRLCFVQVTGWGQKWSSAMIKNILILFCFVKPYCLFQDKYLGSKMLIVAWGYKPRWGGHDAPARNLLTSEGNICHSTLLNFHRKTRTFVRFWISAEQQTKALVCFCVSLYVCLLSVKQALLFVLRWRTFVQFCLAANLLLASQRWKPTDEQTRTLTYGHP